MEPERFGAYTFVEKLGRGGMAEVFLARADSAAGVSQLVAVKRLLGSFNDDSQLVSMLADEARLSVWLYHPNIVQVFDFGSVRGLHYIAMEYVDGCDLMTLLRDRRTRKGRPLPLATAIYTLLQIAEALDYAHRRTAEDGSPLGIIHRDVSPHNVLISREGQVKLADFGLARAATSVHQSATGIIRGKFAYMPKEQAHGRAIDHRIDIFAAGVTLYEALTGVRPYNSSNLAQQLYQLEGEIPPPSTHVPDIPEEIDELTLQAISPSPEDRYQSAAEMADDLRHALSAISTPNQEAQQLAALVAAWAPRAPTVAQERIRIDPRDLAIPPESLIEDEVRAMRLTMGGEVIVAPQRPHEPEERDTLPDPRNQRELEEVHSAEDKEEDEFERAETLYFPGRQQEAKEEVAPDERPGAKFLRAQREKKAQQRAVEGAPGEELEAPEDDHLSHDAPDERFATGSIENSAVLRTASEDAPEPRSETRSTPREDPVAAAEVNRERALSEALRAASTARRRPRRARADAFAEEEQHTHALRRPKKKSLNLALLITAFALVGLGLGAGWMLRGDVEPEGRVSTAVSRPSRETRPPPEPDAGVREARAVAHVPRDATVDRLAPVAPLPPRAKKRRRPVVRRPTKTPPRVAPARRTPTVAQKPDPKLPPHGVLMVTCERPATIFIDDRRVGPTPAKVALPPGIHRVKLLYHDTRDYSSVRFVTVDKGSQSIMRF